MTRESITVVGVSHRTAPLAVRERFAFPRHVREGLLAESAPEALLLVTCNRTELYGIGDPAVLEERLLSHIPAAHEAVEGGRQGGREEARGMLFRHEDEAAAQHLFSVAAGLDSMVLGERQILGQVKRAMSDAREVGALGPILDAFVRRALMVGRRIRRETELGRDLPSIPKVATGMARLILGDLAGRRMLVVGSGKVGDLTARTLHRGGATEITVVNRTAAQAEVLARAIGARAEPFEALDRLLVESDIVLACTAAQEPFLTRARIEAALAQRPAGNPLVLLDVAVPRDVDADVRGLKGVRLCDLDDLRGWGSDSVPFETILAARTIVEEEAADFVAWQAGLSAVPTIRALQSQADRILDEELGRVSGGDPEVLRFFGRRVLRKILHHPIRKLRNGAASNGGPYVELARDLFGLEDAPP